MKYHVHGFLRDVLYRRVERETVTAADGFHLLEYPGLFKFAQRGYTALAYGQGWVGYYFSGIY